MVFEDLPIFIATTELLIIMESCAIMFRHCNSPHHFKRENSSARRAFSHKMTPMQNASLIASRLYAYCL